MISLVLPKERFDMCSLQRQTTYPRACLLFLSFAQRARLMLQALHTDLAGRQFTTCSFPPKSSSANMS